MLVELMIAQMCAGTVGMEHQACVKAVEAATIQYRVKQDVGTVEKKTGDILEKQVAEVTGKTALAVTLFTAKVIRYKEVSANLVRERGIQPSVNAQVTEHTGKLTFNWSF